MWDAVLIETNGNLLMSSFRKALDELNFSSQFFYIWGGESVTILKATRNSLLGQKVTKTK